MKTIGAFEAKTHLSRYLSEVEKKGVEYVILKRGRKAAVLLPYDRAQKRFSGEKARRILEGFREIRAACRKGPPLEVSELVREGRKN